MFTAKRKGLLVFLAALFIAALIGVGIIFAPASARPASAEGSSEQTENSVAKVSGEFYDSLQNAIDTAISGQATTITLQKNVTENVTIPVGKDITLDLNGNTLTNVSDHTIINYGTLTIKGEGTVDNVTHARGAFVNYGKATLLGGTYTRSKEAGTLDGGNGGNSWYVIKNSGVLTIGEEGADCSVEVTANGGYSSLIANGYQNQTDMDLSQQYAEKPVLTIYGGNFSGGLNTLKNDTLGEATIKAGEFGNTSQATILNWNTLLIEGGNFTASSEAQYAIITGADGKTETMKTTITDGEFVGEITYYSNPDYPQYTDDVDYDISGGVFANTLPEEYINDNSLFYPTEGGYKVGSYEENKDDENIALIYGNKAYASDEAAVQDGIVAKIDKTAYATLAEAVAAVPNGKEDPVTVTLIGEEGATIEGSGIELVAANGDKKNIIIDFNGLTYKIVNDLVGSTGTESQGFHLEMGNTVVLKNGTITSDVSIMLVQKYCDLTLKDIILDGSKTNRYVVSNNAGTTTFTGNTQVIAAEGCVAFDVFYWPNGGYAEGVKVIFDKDFIGMVVGKVEYTSDGAKDDWFEKASLTFAEGNKGTFDIELVPVKSENAENAAIDIAGGEFTSALPESYIGDNSLLYPVSTEGVISYKIANAGEVPAESVGVAQVDNAVYATLQEAIDNAPADATVTLLKDINISTGNVIAYKAASPLDKAITIDLAGHKIISSAKYNFVFDISSIEDLTITSSVEGGTIEASAAMKFIVANQNNKEPIYLTVSNIAFKGDFVYESPLHFKNAFSTVQLNVVLENINVKYNNSVDYSVVGEGSRIINNESYSNLEIKDSTITVTDTSTNRSKPFYGVYNNGKGGDFSISNSTITTDGREGTLTKYGLGGPVASIGADLTVTNSTIKSADGPGITFYGSMNTEQALAAGAEKDYKTLIISGGDITGYTYALSGNGKGIYEGTNITVKDGATLTAIMGTGIYQPQVGILNIEGKGTSVTGSSGIEIRAGKLNVKDAAITATAEKFSVIANGGGTTTDGAAIVVAQHSQRAEKWLPISVNLESGTYKGIKAVYQADVLQNGDEAVKEIEMALIGGEYNGAVESQNVTGFIAGGMFSQAVDESYMAKGFAMEEYNGTYIVVKHGEAVAPTVAERVNAQAEVRAYMAAFGLKLSDMQALAGEDGNAAAIVDAYDSLMGVGTATLLAEAKLAAMDAVDAFIDALNAAKASAVEQINEYAANEQAGIVTVPTYVLSAINGATSAAEVQTYLNAAKAEIAEVREQRAAAKEQADALAEKVAGIIEALKITESEEGTWSTTLLNEVMEQLQNANDDTDAILALIGQPADGDTLASVLGDIEEVQGELEAALEQYKTSFETELNNISSRFDKLDSAIEALPEYSEQFEALTEAVGKVQTAVDKANTSLGSLTTEVGSINTTVESMQTVQNTMNEAFTAFGEQFNAVVTDMEGRFNALDEAIAALPDSTYVAGIVQDMQKQFTGLGEKIDALTGADGALTQMDGKIDALDEVVDGIASVQNTMNEAFTEFGKQFNAAVADMEVRFDALDKAIAALPDSTDAIAELKAALAEAQNGITAANEGIAQLGTDLGTVEGKVDAIDSTADSVLAAQNALKTAVEGYKAAADEALADISENLAALDKDLAVLTASTAADKEALSKEIAALQTTANKLEDAVAALDGDSQADLTAITEDLAGLQTSLDGLKADIQKVAQSVTAVEEDSVNSASGFAGLYVFISALVVLVVAVLVVVSLKKRA